jgi:hypothetical protein
MIEIDSNKIFTLYLDVCIKVTVMSSGKKQVKKRYLTGYLRIQLH